MRKHRKELKINSCYKNLYLLQNIYKLEYCSLWGIKKIYFLSN